MARLSPSAPPAARAVAPAAPSRRGGPGLVVGLGCLVAGVPLAAWGLAGGGLLAAFGGLALVLVFVYSLMQWAGGLGQPATPIKPAANSAWNEFNAPPDGGTRKDGQ